MLGFRKDQAFFSGVDETNLELSVGLFIASRSSTVARRELIGRVQLGLQSLIELKDKSVFPIVSESRGGDDLGQITISASAKSRSLSRAHRYQHLSFIRPPTHVEEPLTKSMSSLRYAITVGLAVSVEGKPRAENVDNVDPLIAAYESWPPRYAECCRLINQGHTLPKAGDLNGSGQSLLHIAAIFGNVDALNILLDATERRVASERFVNIFDRNKKDRRQLAPLHYAVIYENLDCIKKLVQSGARLDVAFKTSHPIHMASLLGKEDVVRLLLELGADKDAPDYESNATPVMYASFGGYISVIDVLLGQGAFLDAEDRNGMTALLVAGVAENVPVIAMLLQRSVKPIMSSYDGKVILPWTVLNAEHPELRELLRRFKRDVIDAKYPMFERTLLMKSILCLKDEALMESVSVLLEMAGNDLRFVNAQDSMGKTALHYACCLSHSMVIRKLIAAGAVLNMRDNGGNTPLHFCMSPPAAELLLQSGANVNDVNNNKTTPLHIASAFGLLELRALYKGWGAKELRNEQGKTPKEIINLVAPKHYKIQIRMQAPEPYDEDAGGLVMRN